MLCYPMLIRIGAKSVCTHIGVLHSDYILYARFETHYV